MLVLIVVCRVTYCQHFTTCHVDYDTNHDNYNNCNTRTSKNNNNDENDNHINLKNHQSNDDKNYKDAQNKNEYCIFFNNKNANASEL